MKKRKHCSNLRKILLVLFFNCFVISLLLSQEMTITGKVLDNSNLEPLPGVNIVIEGTSLGTVTDINGQFSIFAQKGSKLEFSYIGYTTQVVTVGDETAITVKLAEDVKKLDEIVVVGYGTMKKSDVTGSIITVSETDFKQVKTTNVIESLQGKAAGVDISKSSGEAGSGFSITIRGERSLSANNDPLYIVDGIQYGSGIDINPNDIASIEILKDVSSTAIYGAKGANGVVIITTKKGIEGKTEISFSTYVGINKPLGSLPYMNSADYQQYKEDLTKTKEYRKTGEWPAEVDINYTDFEKEGIANGTDTRWLDLITRDGYLKNYFLSVAGGKNSMTYNLSLDYIDEIGMLEKDNYKRYVIKGGMDIKVNDYLSIGNSNVLSYKDRSRMDFPEKNTFLMNPLAVPYDSTGELLINPTIGSTAQTPLWYYQDGYYAREELTSRIFSNVYVKLKITDALSIRSTLNVDLTTFRMGYSERASETDVNTGMYIKPSKDLTWSNILTFDKDLGIHHFQVTGVHELMAENTERYAITGINPTIENSLWYALDGMDEISVKLDKDKTGDNNETADLYYSGSKQLAVLGRINYTLLGKYVVTASLRIDGSSVLAEGNKWDKFPAASIAWNASEEGFLNTIEDISMLKIRVGYGTSGNYSVPVYSSLNKTNTSPIYYEFGTPEKVIFGYRPVFAGNPLLSWEKTTATNIGVDFGFFANRISGNIDLYKANTNALLQDRRLPPHAAIPSIYDNIGETETKGIEVMLHTVNISSTSESGFNWTTDLSFTRNDEKIVSLASGVTKDEANGWFVGSPVEVFFDYEKIGIWQEEDSAEMQMYIDNGMDLEFGDIKIRNQNTNEDTVINADDRVVLGQKRPKWYGSITNRFEYKGFDLSIMIMARIGQMVEDDVMGKIPVRDDYAESGMKVNYWTPLNKSNEAPLLDNSVSAINYMPYSSTLLYTDGSWVKIRDITLGYTVPQLLTSKLKISSLRVYVSAKNHFVLYSPLFDKGRYDPEKEGNTSWPIPKTILGGLTLNF